MTTKITIDELVTKFEVTDPVLGRQKAIEKEIAALQKEWGDLAMDDALTRGVPWSDLESTIEDHDLVLTDRGAVARMSWVSVVMSVDMHRARAVTRALETNEVPLYGGVEP